MEREHVPRGWGEDTDPVLELIRRNAISGVVDNLMLFDTEWALMLGRLASETDHIVMQFAYTSVDAAVQCLVIPSQAEIGHVYWNWWARRGGARWLVHSWALGVKDLLQRLNWVREKNQAEQPLYGARRLQLAETGLEPFELACCRLRDVLEGIMSSAGDIYTAPFWRNYEAVCKSHSRSFWHIWWAFARSQVDLVKRKKEADPAQEFEMAKAALERLAPAARALYPETARPCIEELQSHLDGDYDGDDYAAAPAFRRAVELLGLGPYCAHNSAAGSLWR